MHSWWNNIVGRLVIAPKEEHPFFLSFRKKHPTLSFQLMTKEELFASYYGKAIDHIVFRYQKEHPELSLVLAQVYVEEAMTLYHAHSQDEKTRTLETVRQELLDRGWLKPTPYFSVFLHRQELAIFGYGSFDREIDNLCQEEGLTAHYLSLPEVRKDLSVTHFETIEEEIFHVYQMILDLHEQGVPFRQIHLFTLDSGYRYLFDHIGHDFHIPLQNAVRESYLSLPYAQQLLRYYQEHGTFDGIEEMEEDFGLLSTLQSFEKEMFHATYPLWKKMKLFRAFLKNTFLSSVTYQDAVQIDHRYSYHDDEYVFVLGFDQENYPPIHKDDDFLPDRVKKRNGQNTSQDQNRREEETLQQLLFASPNCFLSFHLKAIDGVHHPSMLIQKWQISWKESVEPAIYYSLSQVRKKGAKRLDYEKKYGVHQQETGRYLPYLSDYGTYQSRFQGTTYFQENQFLQHSYSTLKIYAQCPYRYYVQMVLKLDPFEGNFASRLGTYAHEIMEKATGSSRPFSDILAEVDAQYDWTNQEALLLPRLRDELKEVVKWNQEHLAHMVHPSIEKEKRLAMSIAPNASLKGTIDQILFVGDQQQYYAVIDFKTGSEAFSEKEIPYGYSLQLPIYGLLLKEDPKYQDKRWVGAYIQTILASTTTEKATTWKWKGISVDAVSALSQIDSTYANSRYIQGLSMTKEGNFAKRAKVVSPLQWQQYEDTTLAVLKKMNDDIHANRFMIAPKVMNQESACRYCPYQDICYVRDEDKIEICTKEDEKDATVDE